MTSTKIGCPICKHNQMDGTCTAYPEGIPFKFLAGSKHLDPQLDQSGDFVFEWASPVEQREKYLLARHKQESISPSFLQLSIEERRRTLAQQAEAALPYYEKNKAEWEEWINLDIAETIP
jgi:hypothetical protein